MKKILGMFLALVLTAVVGVSAPVYAEQYAPICNNDELTELCAQTTNDDRNLMVVVQNIISIALGIIGVVAVIVIIMAGQRYITAQGDPGKLKMAKDMILWGIVGLVVALLAYAIVSFVVSTVPGETA